MITTLINNNDTFVNYNTTTGSVYANVIVDLNPAALKNATREYITATILYEMLHGYISVRNAQLAARGYGSGVLALKIDDHATMAAAYVKEMKEAILEVFPAYPPAHAEAIAWGGLDNTPAYASFAKLTGGADGIAMKNAAEKGMPGASARIGTKCP